MEIKVKKCRNKTSNNDSCASQAEIDELFAKYQNFYLTLNYINPVINPNQADFISYYTEGNDYVIFSSTVGSEAWIYFSDYTINTDDSIWPYPHTTTQTGCIVEQKAINHPYSVAPNTPMASVYLAKSVNSLNYEREVQKISAVFSYVGGLVGAVTAVLFLVKSYTDSSLEISIGNSIFDISKEEGDEKEGKEKAAFNFMAFLRLMSYRLLKLCGWRGTSVRSERMDNFQREAVKQMDVEGLLRRLIKLETCMTHLFTPQQLQQIRDDAAITLESAKEMRLLFLRDDNS